MPRGQRSVAAGGVIESAMSQMRSVHASLVGEHVRLGRQIAALESAMREIGVAPAGRPGRPPGRPAGVSAARAAGDGRRGVRAGSLKDHIFKVLSGGGRMRVQDIEKAVRAGGFKTKNKTLGKSIGIALLDMQGVERVARGLYELR